MPKVEREIGLEVPAETAYEVWHNFENFPQFMDNIEEVRVVGAGRSHWKAKGPLGIHAEWDAEMTLDEPGRAIGWRSIEGNSAVTTAGRVNFEDTPGGTRLRVSLQYDAPAGAAGNIVTKIFSNPERQVEDDLARFKETIERGWEMSGSGREKGFGDELGSSFGTMTESDLGTIDAHSDPGDSPTGVVEP